jgi:hypothetical protein
MFVGGPGALRADNVDGRSALLDSIHQIGSLVALDMVEKVFDILGVLNCLEEELHCSVNGAEELGSKAGYRGEHVGEDVLVEVIENVLQARQSD